MRGEQAIFNLEIKKKSGLSLNPDIHHSKVLSSDKALQFDPSTSKMSLSILIWTIKHYFFNNFFLFHMILFVDAFKIKK